MPSANAVLVGSFSLRRRALSADMARYHRERDRGQRLNGELPEVAALPQAELVASRNPRAGEMDAYERVLGDAMQGDATLFARENYVEEAWRIVDPVLAANTPVYEYDAGTWGPGEVHALLPPGDWHNPTVAEAVPERIKT